MPERVQQGQVLSDRFRLATALADDPLVEVWRAEDLELRREVVIKLLHPKWMDDEVLVERFRFEALAAARLIHDHVASTYDVEQVDGLLFTVSEYVPGPTVAELCERGPLPADVVASLGHQAALGLAAAHAEGLVHRAVCPQNLVVASDGRLCVIDFGSVRELDADDHPPGPVFPEPGVRTYWPPERDDETSVDDRGDVYSLGLVLWEALTGAPEPGGWPPRSPVRRALARLPGGEDHTPRLRELLLEATAHEPGQRPNAATLAASLTEVCGERTQERVAAALEDLSDPGG